MSPVVKNFDVFKRLGYHPAPCLEAFIVYSFVLKATEPAFGRGVIPDLPLRKKQDLTVLIYPVTEKMENEYQQASH